ncbi:MAG: isoprenylcysteine carboxylmethyltransferase family protein, partial [Candidatus Hydrogenedentes bacterium]|nr:isoprenylcysteine carboxylmethyltransferase family protein [Candidatus Hydrogenedentota bacterium]
IFGIGVLIRVWAQIHLHYRLKIHKILTTTGPYIYVRNPIYIANTIMLLGTTVLSELIWFLPVMFLWCIVIYSFVIRREEIHLLGKYGNPYSEYLRTTPRWIPAAGRINEKYSTQNQMTRFLWPSILAEVHCLLWLIPLIAKEILSTQY